MKRSVVLVQAIRLALGTTFPGGLRPLGTTRIIQIAHVRNMIEAEEARLAAQASTPVT